MQKLYGTSWQTIPHGRPFGSEKRAGVKRAHNKSMKAGRPLRYRVPTSMTDEHKARIDKLLEDNTSQ